MIKPALTPSFNDRAFYSAHFMDVGMWKPAVQWVCAIHDFDCLRVIPCLPGTFPTFRVEVKVAGVQTSTENLVVKFFGPLFDGQAAYTVERALDGWLSHDSLPIRSPRILEEGQFNDVWRYLIFEYIPGVSIGQLRQQLSSNDWSSVAQQMGNFMRQLHDRLAPALPEATDLIQPSWEGFNRFLRQRQLSCRTDHQSWNDLPAHLCGQIDEFLLPVEQLIDFSSPVHLIHADLTGDHLFGDMVGGSWHTKAVIDWGDARTGNLLYELVALHLDLFRADRELLSLCMQAYDLPDFFQHDFSRKALSIALMHPYPVPGFIVEPHMEAETLEQLAERVFGI